MAIHTNDRRKSGKIDTPTFLFCLVAIITIELLFSQVSWGGTIAHLWKLGLVRLTESLVLGVILVRFYSNTGWLDAITLNNVFRSATWGLLTCLVIFLLLLGLTFSEVSFLKEVIPATNPTTHFTWSLLVVGCILAPLAEEVFFRKIVLQYYRYGFLILRI